MYEFAYELVLFKLSYAGKSFIKTFFLVLRFTYNPPNAFPQVLADITA